MKKILSAVIAFAAVAALATAKGKTTTLKVGATPEPHAEILKLIQKDLKAQGIKLKIVEFTDYVTPNKALEDGQIDANYFQHLPYMDSFNAEQGTEQRSAFPMTRRTRDAPCFCSSLPDLLRSRTAQALRLRRSTSLPIRRD